MMILDRKNRKIKIAFIPFAAIIWVVGWSLTFLKNENSPKQSVRRLRTRPNQRFSAPFFNSQIMAKKADKTTITKIPKMKRKLTLTLR
jgi:hypothetical protein